MNIEDVKQHFLRDTKNHKLSILHNDGIYKHLVMDNGTGIYKYSITTWAGYLCISGDMGCYVFSRTKDMFSFFRQSELKINPSYWAEKLQSVDDVNGYKEYSPKLFKEAIKQYYDDYKDEDIYDDKLWEAIEDEVLIHSEDGEVRAYDAAVSFRFGNFEFNDFWETNTDEYTHNFIWCLYAIVYAIQEYDKIC